MRDNVSLWGKDCLIYLNGYFQFPARNVYVEYNVSAGTDVVFFRQDAYWDEATTGKHSHADATRVHSTAYMHLQTTAAWHRSSAVMLMHPLTTASTEFFVPSYMASRVDPNGYGGLLIVSAYDDTCVEAYRLSHAGHSSITRNCLNEMGVLQNLIRDGDYTGVYVNSTKPIAVIGGHQCANIPDNSVAYCDHIMEAAAPVSEWGTEFIVGPILGRSNNAVGYLVRIVGAHPDTRATLKGATILSEQTVERGMFVTVEVDDASEVVTVRCSKPCMVIQYNKGQQAYTNTNTRTDPFMMSIVPNDHFVNQLSFSTPIDFDESHETRMFDNYITIVVQDSAKNDVRLNNRPITEVTGSEWTTVSMPEYAIVSFRIAHGNHSVHHPDPAARVMAYVYGHGSADQARTGYGFAAAYRSECIIGLNFPIFC